jgi:hypothetical protein
VSIPTRLTPEELSAALSNGGYAVTKETRRHVRLTTLIRGEHHVTFPCQGELDEETTTEVLALVAKHHRQTVSELAERLF